MSEHEDVALYAADLFETGQDEELLDLAQALSRGDDNTEPARAEVFRFARIVSVRRRDRVGMELWQARLYGPRPFSSDSRHAAAGLLLPHFFVLVDLGSYTEARLVLDEICTLIDEESPVRQPSAALLHRLCEEKRAFSFLAEGRFNDAEQCYERAMGYAGDLPRARLKIRGGIALCRYLSHPGSEDIAAEVEREMVDILAEATKYSFPDVMGWATENAAVISRRSTVDWVPFEQT